MKKVFLNMMALVFCMISTLALAIADNQPTKPPLSMVSMQLYAEGWVDTTEAKITVNVNAAVNSDGLAAVRETIQNQLNQIAKAQWRITQFQRQRDNAGLDRVMIQAEARVPEAELNNVSETVKKLSKPGQQFDVLDIDFTPSNTAVETAKDKVRKSIYQMANDELTRLNELNQDYPYQIFQIDFIDTSVQPEPLMMANRKLAASAQVAAPEIAVSGKIEMNARVVFAREIIKEGE